MWRWPAHMPLSRGRLLSDYTSMDRKRLAIPPNFFSSQVCEPDVESQQPFFSPSSSPSFLSLPHYLLTLFSVLTAGDSPANNRQDVAMWHTSKHTLSSYRVMTMSVQKKTVNQSELTACTCMDFLSILYLKGTVLIIRSVVVWSTYR